MDVVSVRRFALAIAPALLAAVLAGAGEPACPVRLPTVTGPVSRQSPKYDPAVQPVAALASAAEPAAASNLAADPLSPPAAPVPLPDLAMEPLSLPPAPLPAVAPPVLSAPAAPSEPPCQWAGYENGFFVQTCDGNYVLKFQGGIQMRYNANWRKEPPTGGDYDAFEDGFTLPRVPLIFSGNVITPDLNYSIRLNLISNGDEFVEDAKIFYTFNETWMITGGRFLNPAFLRESDVSFTRQLGVDRSYVDALFTIGYIDGVMLTRQTDFTMSRFLVSDGRNSGAKGVNTDFPADAADVAVTAGVDFKIFGDWAQYGDFTSWRDQDWGLFLGTGFHWEEGETGDDVEANNLNNFNSWTADATLEGHGFSLFATGVGRHANDDASLDQYAVLVQSGYQLVPEKWEPYVRYEYICFDGLSNVGIAGVEVADSDLNLFTIGVNRFLARHAAKITGEVIYAADPVPVAVSSTGLLEDPLGENGQVAMRAQLQLMF